MGLKEIVLYVLYPVISNWNIISVTAYCMYDDNVNKCYSSKFYVNGNLENKKLWIVYALSIKLQ